MHWDSPTAVAPPSAPNSAEVSERPGMDLPIGFTSIEPQPISITDGGETGNDLVEAVPGTCAVVAAQGQEQSALSLGVSSASPSVDCGISLSQLYDLDWAPEATVEQRMLWESIGSNKSPQPESLPDVPQVFYGND